MTYARFIKMYGLNMNNVIIRVTDFILCTFSIVFLLHVVRHITCHAEVNFLSFTICLKHSPLRNQVIKHPLILQIIS